MSKQYYFIEKWRDEMRQKILSIYPSLPIEAIDKKLNMIIDTKFKDHDCFIDNNYVGKTAKSSLLGITEYIAQTKPILAGGGVLFKQHTDSVNASAGLLIESLNERNRIKAERKNFPADSYEFLMRDIGQGNEKVVANSYYGAAGAATSVFYNLYVAAATTGTGQALIATAETSFEALLAGNVKFLDIDECLLFISNTKKGYWNHQLPFTPIHENANEVRGLVVEHLLGRFQNPITIDERTLYSDWLYRTLESWDATELSRLFYKNNLYAFFDSCREAGEVLFSLCSKTRSFKNPNRIPEEIAPNLELLWDYVHSYVAHIFPVRSRIIRDTYHTRGATVTQDTDSTMVTIAKYMDLFIQKYTADTIAAENEDELDFILCNIMAYILTKYSAEFLGRYCKDVNMPEDQFHRINMKNEFYNLKMILTPKKKRYVSFIRLQEGQMIDPPMVKISGLDFIKSVTSSHVEKFFRGIIEHNILLADEVNVAEIIRKINSFKDMIKTSFLNGELTYLNLLSVKDPEAYKAPYSNQGIKGVIVWNAVYPDKQISLPDKVLLVKVTYPTEKKFLASKDLFGDVGDVLLEEIFHNKNELISKPGLTNVCIPQNIDKLPDWIIRTMDIDTMVDDIVSKFNPILESLGNVTIKTRSNSSHMSNIVDI